MADDTPTPAPPDREKNDQVAVKDTPKSAPSKPKPRKLPPYKVLLHNDDKNDMEYVVRTICRLTPLNEEEAIQKMLEAHHQGLTLMLITHRERAELYVDQFASCGLTVTAEPDA
jgi:ATP-dependent Clp protease adaptor protein ClpS